MSQPTLPDLIRELSTEHLVVLGSVTAEGNSIVLIGPDEPAFWPHIRTSAEFLDGGPDPVDRWSARVLSRIAGQFGVEALFPFGGPPWHPFIDWALRSGRCHGAPVSLLVHAQRGLFVSFRGALVVPGMLDIPALANPCTTCKGQPCRSACPVDALGPKGYDVARCKAHLRTPQGAECRQGCLVRRACPVGANRRDPAQSAFHMRAFLGD